ncbi:MAG: tetratricopeptide repeat protein [Verrucomicrobiae bacterium]|nr:tetratricopeptide repeat protein [Verrucomicrobiae bacterium]
MPLTFLTRDLCRHASPLFALLLLAFAAYWPTLRATWVYDDAEYVVTNPLVTGRPDPGAIFTSPYPPGHPDQHLYRPLVTLSFALDSWSLPPDVARGGGSARSPALPYFHLTNLLLHFAVGVVLYGLGLRLLAGAFPKAGSGDVVLAAWIAAALFTVHPVGTESVAWISGRAEILSAFWVLASLWCVLGTLPQRPPGGNLPHFAAAAGCFGLALLSKENAVMTPVLALIVLGMAGYDWKRQWRGLVPLYAMFAAVVAAYLAVRATIFAGIPMEETAFAGVTGTGMRLLIACKVLVRYLGLIATGWGQSVFHDVTVEPFLGVAALLVLIALGVAAFMLRRTQPWFLFGALFFFVALLPVSNLLFAIGAVMAERFLYLPLAGLALALAVLLAGQAPGFLRRMLPVMLIVLGLVTVRTMIRAGEWRDARRLWASAVEVYPRSFLPRAQLGFALKEEGRDMEAYAEFEKSMQLLRTQPEVFRQKFRPSIEVAMGQLGGRLAGQTDDPALRAIHALAKQGEYQKALLLYAAYKIQHPESISAHYGLADSYLRLSMFLEASREFLELTRRDPGNGLNHGKLGYCFIQINKPALARFHYQKAITLNAGDTVSLANLGLLEMREKNPALARVYFEQAIEKGPHIPDYRMNLAGALVELGEREKAAQELRTLLRLWPNHQAAAKMLATIEQKTRYR